jgi:hypothetical protein
MGLLKLSIFKMPQQLYNFIIKHGNISFRTMSMTAYILVRKETAHIDLEFMPNFSRNITKKMELVPVLRIRIRNQNKHFGSGFEPESGTEC